LAGSAHTTVEKAPAPANAGTTASSKYSTQEVHDILARAVDRQAQKPSNRLAFDDLLEAAREVGVEENVLREASREIRKRAEPAPVAPSSPDDEFAIWQRRRKRKFTRHLGVYLIVNIAFAILAMATGKAQMLSVALFWGIGLGIHFLNTLFTSREDFADDQKRQARKDALRQQWVDRHMRRRQRRDETLERVIDEGASLLLTTGSKIRQRIEGVKAKAGAPQSSGTTARTDQPSPSPSAPKDKAGQARLRVDSGTQPLQDAADERRVSAEAEAEARALVAEAEAEARALVDQSRSGQPKG
jgi:eukaryotic-like serine/threonine-protein kinase